MSSQQLKVTLTGISVFWWNINIRASSVLGLVSANGIGLELNAALNILS